jgi:hypothetical protein
MDPKQRMRTIFFLLGFFGLMTGAFFGSAGRWNLPLAWVCLGVYTGFMFLRMRSGTEHLVECGFDGELQGEKRDFRPVLPLIFCW